jgi:hypothetical protein
VALNHCRRTWRSVIGSYGLRICNDGGLPKSIVAIPDFFCKRLVFATTTFPLGR